MNHLTPDELIDAVEQALAPSRRAHLAACDQCGRDVMQLSALLREARAADIPEPAPLFWDRFSDRVRTAIAAEPDVPARLARWFQWPVLAPLGALALLVLSLTWAVPQGADGVMRAQRAMNGTTPSISDAPVFDSDAHWAMVSELVGDLDVDAARDAGIVTPPGSADQAALQLTSAEQQELMRLLREELQQSGGINQ